MLLGKMRGFLHILFLENEEETSQKIYRVMIIYSVENDMQNFRHFCKKRKTLQIVTQHGFALTASISISRL